MMPVSVVAGLILGVSYPVLDELDQRHNGKQQQRQATSLEPSWATTLLCISLFVAQYKLSAVLDQAFHGAQRYQRYLACD